MKMTVDFYRCEITLLYKAECLKKLNTGGHFVSILKDCPLIKGLVIYGLEVYLGL